MNESRTVANPKRTRNLTLENLEQLAQAQRPAQSSEQAPEPKV